MAARCRSGVTDELLQSAVPRRVILGWVWTRPHADRNRPGRRWRRRCWDTSNGDAGRLTTAQQVDVVTTIVIAAATVVVCVATVVYARLTGKLVQKADEQSTTLREQAAVMGRQAAVMAQQADLMREQADAARRALIASTRPLLVDVPRDAVLSGPEEKVSFAGYANPVTVSYPGWVITPEPTPGFVHLSVPARNIGQGPALVTGIGLSVSPDVTWSGAMSRAVIAPGESTRVSFSVPTDRPELAAAGRRHPEPRACPHRGALYERGGW